MKKLLGWFGVAFALIAILYMIYSDKDTSSFHMKAIDGVLDLRELTDSPFISLAGDWKFTADSFVSTTDFDNHTNLVPVPGPWPSNVQWGSYQLKVYLPDHWSDIGLRVRNIWSAHTIYVNGAMISEKGKPADTKQETILNNPAYEVYFTPDDRQLLITIHTSNFYNARGGIVLPIDIGDATQMKEDVQRDLTLEWAAAMCMLIFCMYHLTIYLLRTRTTGEAFLYSGLYFLVMAIMIVVRGERLLIREFPSIPYELYFRLQDASTYICAMLIFIFIVKVIPAVMKRKTLILLLLPLLLYSLLNAILPARSLAGIQYDFFYYIDALFLGLIARIIYLIAKNRISIKRNEAFILMAMLLFIAIFTLSSSSDSLYFTGRNSLNRLGLIGSMLAMNVFLGVRLMNRTEESEKLTARLQKANDTKNDLLKVATQDLHRPLHDAVYLLQSITREHDRRRQSEQLFLAEQLLGNMVYILRDLNDFTRIRFNDYDIQLKSTNLRMVVLHVLQLMQLTFVKKKIQIHEKIPHQLYAAADEQALTQVLLRMMTEITRDTAETYLTLEAMQAGDNVMLHVATSNEFVTTRRDGQHSSGLMMTVELVQQMNGSITYESMERGARFTLRLGFSELKEPDAAVEYTFSDQAAVSAEELEAATVLIVEDDAMHAEVMRGMLSDTYNIRIAYTAQEAIDYYHSHTDITMILMDDIIPGNTNSLELLQQIRKQAPLMELPIIMMIASEDPKHIERIFASGANDYMIKPFSKESLMARLNAVEQTKQSMLKAIEYEMAFLQTQIKPHFLYNALSNIISFCYTDGERAAHLLTMLSSFLRYIFETSRDGRFSTLQKELEIIEAYVEVEKARLGDRLTFAYDIDPLIVADNVLIPSLLLQPLVENAIRHGIFNKEGAGHVQVSIHSHDSRLSIYVIDNGVGISPEQCAQLMGELESAGSGIGFTNVRRRVHDLSQGSLEISSIPGRGTTVHFIIPIMEGLDDVESNPR
ncbi:ATP-binding protein [Paenibacillus sp. strain BS8-2]